MRCTCGSQDIDYQEASGNAVCCACGRIIEENAIVSSLEFDDSGDRANVIGQFISADGTKMGGGPGRFRNHSTTSTESRAITLMNARRAIQQVASLLRLPLLYVEKAHKLYSVVLKQRFTYGRQQSHIVATCLYTVCRMEKSAHLLIDFSDALQVNVYLLGKTFLQFAKLLNLQPQLVAIDPALYIHRFALKCDLGDKLNPVITTSLRIITRMKKDWITTGRRPDSICAVAMLISTRCHDITKTQMEISQIFRVAASTIQRGLEDFRALPSAQLTMQEFNATVSLTSECTINDHDGFDPPSFRRNYEKMNEDNRIEEMSIGDDYQGCLSLTSLNKNLQRKARISLYETIESDINNTFYNQTQQIEEDSCTLKDLSIKDKDRDDCVSIAVNKLTKLPAFSDNGRSDGDDTKESKLDADEQCHPSHETDEDKETTEGDIIIIGEDLDEYILNEDEQNKRSAIFNHCFKKLLDERTMRKAAQDSNNKQKSKKRKASSQSETLKARSRDPNRKSKKINYEVTEAPENKSKDNSNSLAAEDFPIEIPFKGTKRKTLKAGSEAKNTKVTLSRTDALSSSDVNAPSAATVSGDIDIDKSMDSQTTKIMTVQENKATAVNAPITYDNDEDEDDLLYEDVDTYDDYAYEDYD